MDPIVLEAVCGELNERLAGQPLEAVVQIDPHRFLLRFSEPPFPRVHIALHPAVSALHLTSSIKVRAAATELGAAFTTPLRGKRFERAERPPAERRALLRFEGGEALVVELMGKASNMLLLDPDGRIQAFARSHHGAFRHARLGEAYQPPPASSRWLSGAMEPPDARRIAQALERRPPDVPLESHLVSVLPGFSPVVARELNHLIAAGANLKEAWDLIASGLEQPRRPVLYSPSAPDHLEASTPLTGRNLFPFVMPIEHAGGLAATPVATASGAQEQATMLLLRRLGFQDALAGLTGLLRGEARRLDALSEALTADLRRAEGVAASRRHAELLLSQLGTAVKSGSLASVTDFYDPEGRTVEIPIDPRLGLKENAARMFAAARRADRTRQLVPERIAGLAQRRVRVAAALAQAGSARDAEQLELLERSLQGEGILRVVRRRSAPAAGPKNRYVAVNSYRTRDGFTVLVGRTSAENDELTFRVAGPDDLWLHASGFPGAHVVVRNPQRLRELPDSTVREAAAIAAWHSKGRDEKELDVHVTFRRHVRKGRGMSPGMVMLRRHHTVRVTPSLPAMPKPNP